MEKGRLTRSFRFLLEGFEVWFLFGAVKKHGERSAQSHSPPLEKEKWSGCFFIKGNNNFYLKYILFSLLYSVELQEMEERGGVVNKEIGRKGVSQRL